MAPLPQRSCQRPSLEPLPCSKITRTDVVGGPVLTVPLIRRRRHSTVLKLPRTKLETNGKTKECRLYCIIHLDNDRTRRLLSFTVANYKELRTPTVIQRCKLLSSSRRTWSTSRLHVLLEDISELDCCCCR